MTFRLLGERQMRVYQQRIYTSPRSGEVGRGSGRVGPDEAQQIFTPSRESTLPGPESPTLPQAGGCFQLEVYSHLPLALVTPEAAQLLVLFVWLY